MNRLFFFHVLRCRAHLWIFLLFWVLIGTVGVHADEDTREFSVREMSQPMADRLRSLPVGETARLRQLRLDTHATETIDLQIERTKIFAPGATVTVVGAQTTEQREFPTHSHFIGHVVGNSSEPAFLTIDQYGQVQGIVQRGRDLHMLEIKPSRWVGESPRVRSRQVRPTNNFILYIARGDYQGNFTDFLQIDVCPCYWPFEVV